MQFNTHFHLELIQWSEFSEITKSLKSSKGNIISLIRSGYKSMCPLPKSLSPLKAAVNASYVVLTVSVQWVDTCTYSHHLQASPVVF